VRIEWDGETLTVTIPVSPRDPEPIVLAFRPHHQYRRLLDEWKARRARMGEPTLTAHSLSIPLKFPRAGSSPGGPPACPRFHDNPTRYRVGLSGRSGAWGRSGGGLREGRRFSPGMEGPNFVAP